MSNSAQQRLLTLKKWTNDCYTIAQSGLYFFGEDDAYKCAFCKVVVRGWNTNELAHIKHLKANPNCPFIKGEQVGNYALGDFSFKNNNILIMENSMKALKI